jgi:hypothetical protein
VKGAGRALELPGALGLFAGDPGDDVGGGDRIPQGLFLGAEPALNRFGFATDGVHGDLREGLGVGAERLRDHTLRAQGGLVQIERLETAGDAGEFGCGHITSLS